MLDLKRNSEQSRWLISKEEISKIALNFFIESFWSITIAGIFGGLVGFWYSAKMPPEWVGVAQFEMAKVLGSSVESSALLLDKLKFNEYYSEETRLVCNAPHAKVDGQFMSKNLQFRLSPKSSSILTISYKSDSREASKKCIDSVIDDIRVHQRLLGQPAIMNKKKYLALLREQLDSTNYVAKILETKYAKDLTSSSLYDLISVLNIGLNKNAEVNNIQRLIVDTESQLFEPYTAETRVIFMDISPIKTPFFMAFIFFIIGLFFGTFLRACQKIYRTYFISCTP